MRYRKAVWPGNHCFANSPATKIYRHFLSGQSVIQPIIYCLAPFMVFLMTFLLSNLMIIKSLLVIK